MLVLNPESWVALKALGMTTLSMLLILAIFWIGLKTGV